MATLSLRAYYREIEGMIERGRVKEAVAHCRHILQVFPKSIDTYRLLGKAYLEQQRYTEGSDVLQRVLSAVPDDFVSQVGMSMIREDEGNLDAAIWHMERAFEAQPSNVAVQDELRRLYGRRDGVQPAKIRLTRGALVRMYARGDLYQQAIAEARMALVEQPDRVDLEIILARMYYLSNQKVSAADICSRLVEKLPFCLEANRILAEVLPGTARDEDAHLFAQRVVELDPYMAHVAPGSANSSDAAEDAVILDYMEEVSEAEGTEKPDWAQNTGVEWAEEEEKLPDWMVSLGTTPEQPDVLTQIIEHDESEAEKAQQNAAPPSADALANEDTDIPEWMKDAGWQPSEADSEEPAEISEEIANDLAAEAEIPEWLQAIAPAEDTNESMDEIPASEKEEDTRWLESILTPGTPEPSAQENFVPDEVLEPAEHELEGKDLNIEPQELEESLGMELMPEINEEIDLSQEHQKVEDLAEAFGSEDKETGVPDWLAGLASIEDEGEGEGVVDDLTSDPNWLKAYETTEETIETVEEINETEKLEQENFEPEPAAEEGVDFRDEELVANLSPFSEDVEEEPKTAEDFLAEMELKIPVEEDATQPTKQTPSVGAELIAEPTLGEDFESLADEDHLEEPEDLVSEVPEMLQQAAVFEEGIDLDDFGKSNSVFSEVLPDAVDKMGFTEEENLDIPDWLKESLDKDFDHLQVAAEEETAEFEQLQKGFSPEIEEPIITPDDNISAAILSDEGQVDHEVDASFTWLEALAARQGVDEETLLSSPEDRSEDLPEWIKEEVTEFPQEMGEEEVSGEPEILEALSSTENDATSNFEEDESLVLMEEIGEKPQPPDGLDIPEKPEFVEGSSELPSDTQKFEDDFVLPDWLAEEQPMREDEEPTETEATFEPPIRKDFEWITEDLVPEPIVDLVDGEPESETPTVEDSFGDLSPSLEQADTHEGEIDEYEFIEEQVEAELSPSIEINLEDQVSDGDVAAAAPQESIVEQVEEVPDWLMALAEDQTPQIEPVVEDVLPEEFLEKVDFDPKGSEPETTLFEVEPTEKEEWFAETEPQIPPPSLEDTSPIRIAQELPPTPVSDGSELYNAQAALQAQDMDKALGHYNNLIERGEALDEIIHDLRESLDRFPVDVSIWQSLGDAYMRSNQLQEALDAYTKAEELLR